MSIKRVKANRCRKGKEEGFLDPRRKRRERDRERLFNEALEKGAPTSRKAWGLLEPITTLASDRILI